MALVDPPSTEATRADDAISLATLRRVVRKRLWVIVLAPLLAAVGTLGLDLARTPMYEVSVWILVGQEQPNDAPVKANPGDLVGEVQGLQGITSTVVEAVKTRRVAEAVIERLGLQMTPEAFVENLNVEQVHASQFIQVTYKDTSPERAQLIANTIGDVLAEQVPVATTSVGYLTATVWERAEAPDDAVSPSPVRDGLAALALGAMLGVALAFLLEHLNGSWRSPEEVEWISGAPNLGVIPQETETASGTYEGLVTDLDPAGAASEAYRTLRTNLLYAFADNPPKVIVLTSPGCREGKSTACANLGALLAQVNKSVLILDCDLRYNPAQHELFGLRNFYGMVDALADKQSLQKVWHQPLPGLTVITAGNTGLAPFDLAELLSSRRCAELIDQGRDQFDYVLIDSPPVGLTSDPAILATQADGALLVLDAQHTPKWAVQHSLRSLKTVGANVLGTVMNNVEASDYAYFDHAYYRSKRD
jgi:capsular exopolysaccharide synthesis family protein